MRTLIQQVHIYLSLLSFSSLCVFGIIGVHATMAPKWEDRPQSPAKRWEVPFAAPKDLDDEALAEKIRREIAPPLANPIAKQFLRHTPEGKLQLDFYQVNGLTRVIVHEDRLQLEESRVNVLEYLNRIHATTIRNPSPDWRVRAWVWYNELAVWSLLGMALTGILLWLTLRLTHKGAFVASVLGAFVFLLIYWRLQ
ncbi:MAG: hypothetical protein INH43_11545 [Acidobacteriaceae bacterium]|jgi:hypothetical protein|nr:hypothetical protein [Acidobacteriaceae bacterium]